MTNHMRYLVAGSTLCEDPTLLGVEFILNDMRYDEPSCPTCMQLIMNHNRRECRKEAFSENVESKQVGILYLPPEDKDEDEVTAMQGLVVGVLAGSAFWILILMVYWLVAVRR